MWVANIYKLLPQIIPLFPTNIRTFIDLFGGGFNVGINVDAEEIVYNDIQTQVVYFLECLKASDAQELLKEIDGYIEQYQLTKENKEGYLALREEYNSGDEKTPMKFYTLLCYSFNNQIRFNSKSEYNMPFGKGRSSFNPALRQKFVDFHAAICKKNCYFVNMPFHNFLDIKDGYLSKEDFVYCDPPYFNSLATYNENGGWTEENERYLLDSLDYLDGEGVKFALSNNLKLENKVLDKWKDKYNVHYLNGDYSNCNYHKKDKSRDIEVLITNY